MTSSWALWIIHIHVFVCVCFTGSVHRSRDIVVTVPLVNEFQGNCWQAKIIEQNNRKIKLSVISPPTAPIGQYELSVITGASTFSSKPENYIYLLFNPWCEGKAWAEI